MDDIESLNHSVWDCKLCFVTHNLHYALVVVMRERACLCLDLKHYHSEACA